MPSEPENQLFQELIKNFALVLATLEREILIYKNAQAALSLFPVDQGAAAAYFAIALESARQNQQIQRGMRHKTIAVQKHFAEVPHLPFDSKISLLLDYLKGFVAGHPELFPPDSASGS